MTKKRLSTLVALVTLLTVFPLAQAFPLTGTTPVTPGSTVPPGDATGAPAGAIAAQRFQAISQTCGTSSSSLRLVSQVRREATGTLDFYFQITNNASSTDPITRIASLDFDSFLTNVGFRTDGASVSGSFVNGTVAPLTADRSTTGSIVGFNFGLAGIPPGSTSNVLVISTNATNFSAGGSSTVSNGCSTTFDTFVPIGPIGSFEVNYFAGARGSRPDQTVRITNPGTNTEDAMGGNTIGSDGPETADLCANIYVFSPDQQMAECCSCFVSPNGLRTLSVDFDLARNPLTPVTLGEGVIKIVASAELETGTSVSPAGVCTQAAGPGAGRSTAASAYQPVEALRAWGTHNQDVTSSLSGAGVRNWVTETHFLDATLSNAELNSLQSNCDFIQRQGSGAGRCTCGRGD